MYVDTYVLYYKAVLYFFSSLWDYNEDPKPHTDASKIVFLHSLLLVNDYILSLFSGFFFFFFCNTFTFVIFQQVIYFLLLLTLQAVGVCAPDVTAGLGGLRPISKIFFRSLMFREKKRKRNPSFQNIDFLSYTL